MWPKTTKKISMNFKPSICLSLREGRVFTPPVNIISLSDCFITRLYDEQVERRGATHGDTAVKVWKMGKRGKHFRER